MNDSKLSTPASGGVLEHLLRMRHGCHAYKPELVPRQSIDRILFLPQKDRFLDERAAPASPQAQAAAAAHRPKFRRACFFFSRGGPPARAHAGIT